VGKNGLFNSTSSFSFFIGKKTYVGNASLGDVNHVELTCPAGDHRDGGGVVALDDILDDAHLLVLLGHETVGVLLLLDDDVDVTSNELRDGVTFKGLDRVVVVRVVAKVEGEALGRGSPAAEGGEGPDLEHLLCLGVETHDRVTGNTQQDVDHLVLLGYFFLCGDSIKNFFFSFSSTYADREESDTVRLEGAAELDVAELGVELSHALQLAVLLEDLLLSVTLELDVVGREDGGEAVLFAQFSKANVS